MEARTWSPAMDGRGCALQLALIQWSGPRCLRFSRCLPICTSALCRCISAEEFCLMIWYGCKFSTVFSTFLLFLCAGFSNLAPTGILPLGSWGQLGGQPMGNQPKSYVATAVYGDSCGRVWYSTGAVKRDLKKIPISKKLKQNKEKKERILNYIFMI